MKIDSHMHPYEKKKSLEGMREFVIAAREGGFEEISFTEHGVILGSLNEYEFQEYVDYTMQLRDEFSSPGINLGIELDYHPERLAEARAIIEKYPFDYVLGSVHVHTGLYRDNVAELSFAEIADFALDNILDAVRTGIFDTITHLDFFRILAGEDSDYNPALFKDKLLNVFQAMEEEGVCLEVNASSMRRKFLDLHPTPEILSLANNFNLKYTFSSDAHEAQYVGAGFSEVMNALTENQKRNMVTFRNRKSVGYEPDES
ncbi:MAG: PHP domain-containing protein [Planctomycetota bacterium]|jgi:histidinol-phosphatase (PHP family)